MLRTQLFKAFALLVVLFSILSAVLGIRIINERVIQEAQTRVTLDLSSAWSIYNSRVRDVEVILRLAAVKEAVVDMCRTESWASPEVQSRLERIRVGFGLDFLDVLSPEGEVKLRTAPPHTVGDYRIADPSVASAIKGEPRFCLVVLSAEELKREGDGLAERAFLELEDTPRSRKSSKAEESRGMVMVGAVPVVQGQQLLGIVYGGILLNRNNELVDRIRDVVFKNEEYEGAPMGTATIFLGDSRIATTVQRENGNRALGTRVSKEVADRVLDNGRPWLGEAFVVRDTYLSAYDPIHDGEGQVIGMLYVGILKTPFVAMARSIVWRYVYMSVFVLLVALVLAFFISTRLARPIHRLVEASNHMSNGTRPPPVAEESASHETDMLIRAFNQMTATLAEREERLKALNRSYMETLGFVSHELKSPVATIVNYAFLLREGKMGPLTELQRKAVKAVDAGGQRLVEMVRHYLNLSRIENGQFKPVPSRVGVRAEVLAALVEGQEAALREKEMALTVEVGDDLVVYADLNMVREVFENLLSNAIKYGRASGRIAMVGRIEGDSIEFRVRNDGEGIPRERLGDLFQKFSRIDPGGDRQQKGTGLGLFITKSIVEAHGGTIRAESQPGEWVEFILTLPRFREGRRA